MATKKKAPKRTKKKPSKPSKKRSAATRATTVDSVADKVTSLKRDAKTPEERRQTLDWALNLPWANADVARIERVDTTTWHGWEMWPL